MRASQVCFLLLLLAAGASPYACTVPQRELELASAEAGGGSGGAATSSSGGGDASTTVGEGGDDAGATAGGATAGSATAGGATTGGTSGAGNAGSSGASGAPTLDPPPMDGLALWLVGDKGSELYGPNVTKWRDQSANGLVLQQAVSARQPTLLDNALAGRRAMYFDGRDDAFTVPANFTNFSQGLSIFAVMRMDTVPVEGAEPGCVEILDLTGSNNFIYFMAFSSYRYEADMHFNAVNGPPLEPRVPHLVSVIHAPAGPNGPANAQLRQDGAVYGDGAANFPLPSGTHSNNGLAGGIDTWCDQFHGIIAELLVYNRAVSLEEEMAITARMQEQWQCCGQ